MATYDDNFLFATLNPKGENHWFYTDFLNIWEAEDKEEDNWLNYANTTMYDNPIMTDKMIHSASKGIDPNSPKYKRDILGLRYDAEGLIWTVNDSNIIKDFNPNNYLSYITVCDPGEIISATSIICMALRYDSKKGMYCIDILKEYWHRNKDNKVEKMFCDYADDYAQFILECKDMFGYFPVAKICDESNEFYRNIKMVFPKYEIKTDVGYPDKPKDEERILTIGNLLYKNQLSIYDKCKYCISDLQNATYDEKAKDKGELKISSDFTMENAHLDSLDSIVYGIYYYYNKLFRRNN